MRNRIILRAPSPESPVRFSTDAPPRIAGEATQPACWMASPLAIRDVLHSLSLSAARIGKSYTSIGRRCHNKQISVRQWWPRDDCLTDHPAPVHAGRSLGRATPPARSVFIASATKVPAILNEDWVQVRSTRERGACVGTSAATGARPDPAKPAPRERAGSLSTSRRHSCALAAISSWTFRRQPGQ